MIHLPPPLFLATKQIIDVYLCIERERSLACPNPCQYCTYVPCYICLTEWNYLSDHSQNKEVILGNTKSSFQGAPPFNLSIGKFCIYTYISKSQHYWHFGLDNPLSWDAVLCIVECWTAFLASLHPLNCEDQNVSRNCRMFPGGRRSKITHPHWELFIYNPTLTPPHTLTKL